MGPQGRRLSPFPDVPMAKNPELIPHKLVAQLYDLDAQIEELKDRKAALETELIDCGEGHYVEIEERSPGAGKRKAVVVKPSAPKPTYTLYPDALKKAFLEAREAKKATPELLEAFAADQEAKARKLAGINFGMMFDRVVVYRPAPAFADLVTRLMGKATATRDKLLLLCQVTKKAGADHVKLLDKPKKQEAADEEE